MADIRLAKPAAGTTQTIPSAPDGRFIFDFPADAATLTRSGDNLVLTFEDGASIQLQGFYTTYSKEEMPSFQVDGVEISGQDFFAALGEDLMPAAGPAASSSAARGGRYNEYGGSDLLDGIDHLGRLDVGFDGGVQLATDTVEPSPWYEGDGWVDHGVTVTPLDSDAAAEVVTVHESGLANGTTPGAADAPVSAGGSLIINAPDGVASIVIGNVTVFENGALTGNTVSTDEGTLTVTGYDPATGRLDFNYTLDRNTTEHDKSDPATDTQISHDLTVTVTDTDGDSGSTTITVNVVDDVPKINLTGASSGLLVDETFGSNGSQDVNDGGTGTATLDASRLFDVDGGADGVADMSYSLTLSQQPNDLTAIVDGQEYNVTFAVFNGQVHAMAGNTGKDIFTVSINEDTGEVTLQLTGKGSLKHPTSSNDDEILNNIIDDINVKLTVTDNDGDVTSSEVQLEIQVEDDAVQVTSAGEPKLELDESDLHGTGVQDVVNVSNNFTVVASADGEAGRSYELTLDPGAENPLVAFVGGEMMPVILSINNEGRIVGMAGDTEIFNVHVDSKGNVTFTLENNGTLVHPDNSDPDDVLSLNGIGVKLTVTDGDGDSSSAEIALDLTIRDDGPVARADNVTLTEAQAQAGGSGANVLDNDVFGADAPAYKTVSSVNGGNPGEAVNGTYGTLTLNADGTYTYQLNEGVDVPKGESVTEEFTYTIKDADGDTSEATLTITIKGDENVPVVTVTTPGAGDANIMVDEGALQAGSGQHTEHGVSGTDSFTVQLNGEDGVITVGGENGWTVTVTGDSAKVTGSVVTVNGVAVTVTEATQAADGTWTVNYSYELGGDQQHATPTTGDYHTDELTGEIAISVTDATGDTAEGTLTVEVHDDGPVAKADDVTLTEAEARAGGSDESLANVLTNDVFGADAPADKMVTSIDGGTLGQPVSGEHGTLTLNADGTYTYQLNEGVDVPKGESVTEEFTYTIKDADGDTSEATLTITIKGDENVPVVTVTTPGAGDANIMVDEGALQAGSGQHTEHGVSGTDSFTVQLNGEDGVITVGGENGWTVTVTGDSAKVTGSVVTVNGVAVTVTEATQAADGTWTVNYSYELGGDQQHATPTTGDYHTDELTGEIAISVTDATGDTAEGTLTVEVHDDGPTITASDMSTTLVPGGGAGNLDDGQAVDFTQGVGNLGHSTSLDGWSGVTMHAAKVTYSGSGDDVQISDIDYNRLYNLKYSPYKDYGSGKADWGLTVDAGEHNEEISVIGGNASEAVVFDLGGQLAYGVTIDFGAFYNGEPGATGTTQWDHVSEKALVTFYRDGQIVGSTVVEGQSSDGTFTLNSSDVVLGGFDKVVISAVDNRTPDFPNENSDFTIQGIDFITKRDDPIIINEGKVTAESGADGFADAYTDIHARFDLAGMVNEGTLSADGTSGTITVLVDGQQTDVTLTLSEGASGDSILTGTAANGEQLFTATLGKDGNWSMEQYEDFRVTDGTGEGSNQFELVFKTEDADGDVASTTVNVPLEVVDQTPATDTSIGNGDDIITITGGEGIAGTVAAGDSGGVEVQTTVQPGQDYNISIMLDLSGSMADPLHLGTNTSRIEMAVDALKNFFETSLQNHDGDISLQLVGFGTGEMGTRTWTIEGDASDAEKQRVYDEFANQLNAWQKDMNSWGYSQGTNYEAAMEKATEWFSKDTAEGGVAGNGGENLAFFISDGKPTYYYDGTDWWGNPEVEGEGNYSNQETVRQTLEAAQDLQNAGSGVKVNAIGIGTDTSLNENAQTILDLIDNTGGSGQNVARYPYQTRDSDKAWTNGIWRGDQPLVEGDSDLVNSEDDLTAALVGGGVITSTDLADAGDDTIRAEHATSSTIIYGDVMNTDRLRYELIQTTSIAAALVAAGIDYGSGADVFQWLENAANANALKGTKFEGWTHDDSVKYMLQHAEELGYETRVDADGDFYLVKADGTVLNMDGSEAGIDLDSLTGRDGGDDVITGSSASDTIYGQEGHDTIYGGGGHDGLYGGTGDDLLVGDDKPENLDDVTVEGIKDLTEDELDDFIKSVEGTDDDGNDQLFGGVGDDVLLGMGGDDYLDGGAGEDAIFGGAGNDIIVYDKADYLVSGGSGIDFMVSDDKNLTLDSLLSNTGSDKPLVSGIEVLLKGDAALSLTSIQDLADRYGITLGTNADGQETLTLDMSKWNESISADGTHVFTSTDNDLTLETNLQHDAASSSDNGEMAQQVFILENTNS
ncbi:DUF5801 repeats-in-toxin domain-containing protein [uncultured Desulfovibrio sp.]|uniref:DUF5801 repeats-in-toxin domain-containing protein n=1 Tax=uncultured Desulfovibrio sp. TaxID=167968 RepID=UPI0028059716|nr:DUF5801 repeats-in-toxin domain-containing protein [uncultured Desulfovibrio sp.]